jgi:hypothetical protein
MVFLIVVAAVSFSAAGHFVRKGNVLPFPFPFCVRYWKLTVCPLKFAVVQQSSACPLTAGCQCP